MAVQIAALNEVVIEEIKSIRGFDRNTGLLRWESKQVEDASLTFSGDPSNVTDYKGATIMQFYRAITAELSVTCSIMSLSIMAAQAGGPEKLLRGATDNKITVPIMQSYKVTDKSITLDDVPVGTAGAEIPYIYLLDAQGLTTATFKLGAEPSETDFTLNAAEKLLTLPTSVKPGDTVLVKYDAEKEDALKIIMDSESVSPSEYVAIELKCHSACNDSERVYGDLILPNTKMSPDRTINLTFDGKQEFTMQAMPDYCSEDKNLCEFYLRS